MSPSGEASWFELSEDGWRRRNRSRPLGALIREALQNAFDHRAPNVQVRIGEKETCESRIRSIRERSGSSCMSSALTRSTR